jgi:hypothetical protein
LLPGAFAVVPDVPVPAGSGFVVTVMVPLPVALPAAPTVSALWMPKAAQKERPAVRISGGRVS